MQKIGIIEDDAILRDLLSDKLSNSGYEVVTAENGNTGMELIRGGLDLVLLDITLPQKSGLEILEEMQKDSNLSSVPVIAISNSGDQSEIDKAQSLGAKDFLVKAMFDSNEVVEHVNKALKENGKEIAPNNTPAQVPETPDQVGSEEAVTPPTQTGGKTVLIVEDDQFLRELAAKKLTKEGYTVFTAEDGEKGVEEFKNNLPGLVILDIILPGIDGYEVLKQIRQDPNGANVPVVVLSNMGQEDDIERAKELGATDYLVKAQFSFGEIVKKIQEVIGK